MTTGGELRCEVCGVRMLDGHPLFRTGPKGKGCDPHWRCEPCVGEPISPTVLAITDAITLGVDPHSLDGVEVIE